MFLFLLLVASNNSITIPVVKENTRLKLALAIPIGTPITLVKEIILIPPLIKQLKSCQINQKQQCIYLVFTNYFFLEFLNQNNLSIYWFHLV